MEKRWYGLDLLKALVVFLVVVMHSNVTYSGIGSWYYVEGSSSGLDGLSKVIFGLYGAFVQSWFMGLMFFISGFFALGSLVKRPSPAFLKEKLYRLGLPLAFYVFLLSPWITSVLLAQPFHPWEYLRSGVFLGATGPLWFVEVLLLLFGVLAVGRKHLLALTPKSAGKVFRLEVVLPLAAVVAGFTFLLRTVMPIGHSWLNLQFPFFPAYILLFFAGFLLRKSELLEGENPKRGGLLLMLGFLLGLPGLGILLITGGALEDFSPFMGGWGWQSLAYSFWEVSTALLMTAGLVLTLGVRSRKPGGFSSLLADCSFGIFLFHAPVLVFFSLQWSFLDLPPLAKHAFILPQAYGVTLGLVWFLRKVPVLRNWL